MRVVEGGGDKVEGLPGPKPNVSLAQIQTQPTRLSVPISNLPVVSISNLVAINEHFPAHHLLHNTVMDLPVDALRRVFGCLDW